MIVLITTTEKDRKTGKMKTVVSHGVDVDTMRDIVLPPISPSEIGYFNNELGEWVLKE